MKSFLKRIIPQNLILEYHKLLAILANIFYLFPSKDLIVIGVTGTNGKSTTTNLIAKLLEESGKKVGFMTTINQQIGDNSTINPEHITMQGRFKLQRNLRKMVKAGCKYAVIETSSEGVKQFRHWGIRYDVAVITNLTPEHIKAHGSFENYKKAKGKLFEAISKYPPKKIDKKVIKKALVVNLDDENWQYFLNFLADTKYAYGLKEYRYPEYVKYIKPKEVKLFVDHTEFLLKDLWFKTSLIGEFNVYNALAAICVALHLGFSLEQCKTALTKVNVIPGRMETIDHGQNFSVLIDYAHDPKSFETLFNTLNLFAKKRIIHVFGCAGGDRDHTKRPVMGKQSGKQADITIITDEDSYEESTDKIIDEIAAGAILAGKKENIDLFKISDRKEAIKKACLLAQEGDLVLITGKGHEQSIQSGGKIIDWDDRLVTKKILQEIK